MLWFFINETRGIFLNILTLTILKMKARMYNFSVWIPCVDPNYFKYTLRSFLEGAGFGVCDFSEKYFEPFGYTCVYTLSESHLAVHTFPEENTAYLELSSCVPLPFAEFCSEFLASVDFSECAKK